MWTRRKCIDWQLSLSDIDKPLICPGRGAETHPLNQGRAVFNRPGPAFKKSLTCPLALSVQATAR